jgi:hypothetical protein
VTERVEGTGQRGRGAVLGRPCPWLILFQLTTASVVVAAVVAVVFRAKRGDVRPPVDNVSADTR